MQVNLPPPPLINITFSGQPALSTGVVNLRALLGSTDYVLVKVGPTQGRGKRARGGVSEEVPEDGYTDDDDDEISNNSDAAGNSSVRREVQLCSHAGQPLGCFLVEAGGSYEVVRHVDIFWGLPCGPPPGRRVVAGKKAARERDGEKEKGNEEGEKEDEGEEDARNKHKRQSKRQKEEEKAEKSQKEKKKSEKSKRQEERKAAIVAAVEAAEVNNIHNNNNNNEEDAEVETRAVHQSDDAEKTAETERDNGKFPAQIQAVHLETPLTQSPGAEEEQREKEEESSSPAPVRTKTVSPPLVASKLPVMETRRRRRPLDNLSSSSSREPANRHHPAESDGNDNEEAQEERRITKRQGKSKGGRKKKKCHDSGAVEAVFGGTNNSATPVYNNSLTANVHNEQEQPARVASTPAPNGSAAVDPISSRNSNGMKSKEASRNGLGAETNSAAERRTEEEEEEADDRASSNMVNNGWAPLESPALGFTSVDNTLSQDFSLDSSSIASSADYVY